MVIRVESPYFIAGIVIHDGVVTETAPILKWAMNKSEDYIIKYFEKRGWKYDRLW